MRSFAPTERHAHVLASQGLRKLQEFLRSLHLHVLFGSVREVAASLRSQRAQPAADASDSVLSVSQARPMLLMRRRSRQPLLVLLRVAH